MADSKITDIAARIEAQVMSTRATMAQMGIDRHAIETLETCTSHFLDMARDLRGVEVATGALPAKASAVLEPMVLVPRYPTQEMMDAGLHHCPEDISHDDLFTAWTAMFDALPLDGGASLAAQAKGSEA